MRYVILVTLMISMLVTTARAQSFGPPTYSVGDSWTFTTRKQTVVKIDGDVIVMNGLNLQCLTCLYHFDKNLTLLKVEQEDGKAPDSSKLGFLPVGPDWKFWTFPLELKKEWRISASGLSRGTVLQYTIDSTVVAYEGKVHNYESLRY